MVAFFMFKLLTPKHNLLTGSLATLADAIYRVHFDWVLGNVLGFSVKKIKIY